MIGTMLIVFLAVVLAVILFIAGYIMFQGDEDFRIFPSEKGQVKCEYIDEKRAVFSTVLPYRNVGKQLAMVLDVFPRLLLPKEQFDLAKVSCRIEHSDDRRDDGYMQAFISDAGDKGELIVIIEFEAKEGNSIKAVLENMVDVMLDAYTVSVGRTMPQTRKTLLTIDSEEINAAAGKGADGIV